MPEAVSIVTGNQTAKAISPTAENSADGRTTIASGIHAVAGIGPTTLRAAFPSSGRGEPADANAGDQRKRTPNHITAESSHNELHVLSSKTSRSSMRLCIALRLARGK